MGNMTNKIRKYHSEAESLLSNLKPGVNYRINDLITETGYSPTIVHYIVRRALVQAKPGSPLWSLPVTESAATPAAASTMNLATAVTSVKSSEV
jgi:hypothetical protein